MAPAQRMDAVTAADEWAAHHPPAPPPPHTEGGGTGTGSTSPPNARAAPPDTIDSMLQAQLAFPPHAPSTDMHHHAHPMAFQRRGALAPPAAQPPPPGHPSPVQPPPFAHFPSLQNPLPIPVGGRYPASTLPALAPPLPAVKRMAEPAHPGVNAAVGVTVSMGAASGAVDGSGGTRAVSELLSMNSKQMTAAECRKVRKVLLGRKRARRSAALGLTPGAGSHPGAGAPLPPPVDVESAAKRPALDTAALAQLDKKTQRQIKNRDVALKARQKAKARLHRLESENTHLKNRASTLELENDRLKTQIEKLQSSMDGGALGVGVGSVVAGSSREQSWNGDVSLESMVAP